LSLGRFVKCRMWGFLANYRRGVRSAWHQSPMPPKPEPTPLQAGARHRVKSTIQRARLHRAHATSGGGAAEPDRTAVSRSSKTQLNSPCDNALPWSKLAFDFGPYHDPPENISIHVKRHATYLMGAKSSAIDAPLRAYVSSGHGRAKASEADLSPTSLAWPWVAQGGTGRAEAHESRQRQRVLIL